MKIILAPDSFKGTIRSPEVCQIVREAFLEEIPEAEIVMLPMADGGEGTVDAVTAATGAEIHHVMVEDALGRPVKAKFAYLSQSATAVMEMAEASGIERLARSELNPERTSTFGTGTMMKAAKAMGARKIVMGIGGSATVDGGLGMALALGAEILGPNGQPVAPEGCSIYQATVFRPGRLAEWKDVKIQVACDVTNLLTGDKGSAPVFGPQKGADPEMVKRLNAGLKHWFDLVSAAGLGDGCEMPGDGAAGGLGFALRVLLNADIVSGASLVADIVGLREQLENADLVITGEGQTDNQTAYGKLPAVIADMAAEYHVPTILLSGAVTGEPALLRKKFIASFDCVHAVQPLDNVLADSKENLYNQARNIAALLKLR